MDREDLDALGKLGDTSRLFSSHKPDFSLPDQDTSNNLLIGMKFDPHGSSSLFNLFSGWWTSLLLIKILVHRSNRLSFVAPASTPPGTPDTTRCFQTCFLNDDVSRQRLLPLWELKIQDFDRGHPDRPTGG